MKAEGLQVSGADKLHNARAIVNDLLTIGAAVFERITVKKDGTLWYYRSLSEIFSRREAPMKPALADAVAQMERLAAV